MYFEPRDSFFVGKLGTYMVTIPESFIKKTSKYRKKKSTLKFVIFYEKCDFLSYQN